MASSNGATQHRPQQPPHSQQPPQHRHTQGLPSISSLTNGLPATSQQQQTQAQDAASATEAARDSGTWPQPQSKHMAPNNGLQVRTLLNPDDSPSRNSIPSTPHSAQHPGSAQSGNSTLPSLTQGFQDHGQQRQSRDWQQSMESRRSSVDSRMHHAVNNLYINQPQNNPHSPYESANASQVSLAASLRRPNGGQPMSPLSGRSSIRSHAPSRIAPPIIPVGRAPGQPDPTASKPTQGFAWAFPDSTIAEDRRESDSGESSVDPGISRQNSFTASSIRSSIFSSDSHMPPGQRRFDDADPTTHHHTMQHRTIQSLQNESVPPPGVAGNYSRTPELRVSHKLAERKRRSEMKDLFEDLNKAVPSSGGGTSKASKWEILTKAIEYIRQTQHTERHLTNEVQRLQRDSEYGRETFKENEMLKTELQVMHQHLRRLDPSNPHVYGHYSSQISSGPPPPPQQSQAPPPQTNGGSRISLPPLNHANGGPPPQQSAGPQYGSVAPPPPSAMQGVEYGYSGR